MIREARTGDHETAMIREARTGDRDAVLGILNAAMLETDAAVVDERIGDGDVLVAVDDGRVIGALVLDGAEITAVAVRPGRRGRGVGTALVEAALARRDRVVATFDASVRPFYESLGFDVSPADEGGRFRGVRGG